MFKKPFKVKSQIQLKSSEKKKFGNDVKNLFPALSDEEISFFSNSKDSIMKMKIVTFSDEIVEVYLVDKLPMFFDVVDLKVKLPTVYMCWKFPHIVTMFTTDCSVLDKIRNGADLFLPGVYLDTADFEKCAFQAKDAAAVNLTTNSAAFAVGQCLMSKNQVLSEAALLGGRLLKVFHAVGDYLCKIHPQPMPSMDPPFKVNEKPDEDVKNEEVDTIDRDCTEEMEQLRVEDCPNQIDNSEGEPRGQEMQLNEPVAAPDSSLPSQPLDEAAERARMDELMVYCFLKAIKTAPKTIYPILPAAFYANHMLPAVPEGQNLNVKRTKWKKLSGLLQEMAVDGVVQLETLRGNEFRLVAANLRHNAIREFVDPHHTPVTVEAAPAAHAATSVQEVFVVTAPTQPLFIGLGLQKGDEVTRLDVRAAVADYVRREGLVLPESPDRVRLDVVLRGAVRGQHADPMTRLELLAAVLATMPLRHKVSTRGDLIVHKANLPLVEFEVVTRSGNKKVTIISNVEGYGVDVAAFAKSLQHAAAASTTVTGVVPGKKGPQVQVQGNQILVAAKLLSQSHGIGEKFMRGLEKAPKSRKK